MSKTHTCEELVEIATRYRNRSRERGIELVVVVTDEEGPGTEARDTTS